MNYFIANLFRDWKWWAKLGFVLVVTLDIVDILSASFAAPGFFNLWMVRITIIAGFSGLLAYYFYQRRHDKKNRQLEILLPAFMAERREYFETMVAADPKFQTFCFECLHYEAGRRCCSLHLHDREIKIKLHSLDVFSYCLYWNLSDHPIMGLTKSLFPPKGDNRLLNF
ncbi:MAG: hypothetical protein WCL37_06885 [Chrysiogenales bacterium]